MRKLLKELPKLVGAKATLQSQAPISILPDSELEPDFAIVKNSSDDYLSGHPTPEDVLLVMEVSDSSIDYDQDVKLPLYAEAGISDYWIFNLADNQLECYSEPYKDNQGKYNYKNKRIELPNQIVKLPCFPNLEIDLSKIFPA